MGCIFGFSPFSLINYENTKRLLPMDIFIKIGFSSFMVNFYGRRQFNYCAVTIGKHTGTI